MIARQTNYFNDFTGFYARAAVLNMRNAMVRDGRNLGTVSATFRGVAVDYDWSSIQTEDDLQNKVPIYDTIWRRWAGFSKVLEDAWKGPWRPIYRDTWKTHAGNDSVNIALSDHLSVESWLYVFLLHRATGSGASFEADHGYRNSIVSKMLNDGRRTVAEMVDFVKGWQGPMFTSIGNQPPAFNKPTPPYATGGRAYFCEDAPRFVFFLADWLRHAGDEGVGIKTMTDHLLAWHRANGMKQYKFVLTAFAMDLAEYFPQYVNTTSHVYFGKNAVETCNLLFEKVGRGSREDFQDSCMEQLLEVTQGRPCGRNLPYSMEDVMCDFVRYKENHIPKHWSQTLGYRPTRLPLVMDTEPRMVMEG